MEPVLSEANLKVPLSESHSLLRLNKQKKSLDLKRDEKQ